ncbi:uncharacterized protein CMU_019390 [Cryptosporidium muris RN66]|uniref:Uncharacterized protein n=1 Tax=Cryptosporidium muris (strain RN66) TaxID=441375 RepID=B6ACC6_CRYMR|nr:uncharacterized protein CMU_019390 [Cryptosporidium muris RN66]EEA06182.1 hypothetical protein, conserved [Cryptosporidium muris RN66]|eukprot:XP_002140531.1 hypothetical protein [Cryptosporidium muris RN66]
MTLKISIGVFSLDYDETITQIDTFEGVIFQACKIHYEKLGKDINFKEMENNIVEVFKKHRIERENWCGSWLPNTPLKDFRCDEISKLFLSLSEFESHFNCKMDSELIPIKYLNEYIVNNSSQIAPKGCIFKDKAHDTIHSLSKFSKLCLIISIGWCSERILQTVKPVIYDDKNCELKCICNEFLYDSPNGVVTAPNGLYGPTCKYRRFKQEIEVYEKKFKRNVLSKLKYSYLYRMMKYYFKNEIYIHSIFIGDSVTDLESILFAEIGIIIGYNPKYELNTDSNTVSTVSSQSNIEVDENSTINNSETGYQNQLILGEFLIRICKLFAVNIVPIDSKYISRCIDYDLKVYNKIKRNDDGIVNLSNYVRNVQRLRSKYSNTSLYNKFSGICLIASCWDDIYKLFHQ